MRSRFYQALMGLLQLWESLSCLWLQGVVRCVYEHQQPAGWFQTHTILNRKTKSAIVLRFFSPVSRL